MNTQRGMGFVEVMISLVFFLILGGLVTKFVLAVESTAQKQVRQAREGVMLMNSGLAALTFDLKRKLPTSVEGGLQLLVTEGYMETLPKDPWGGDYQLDNPGSRSGWGWDLYSLGPDGVVSEDDIMVWDLYAGQFKQNAR
jgi:general secretion pathway protein G